MKRIHTIPNQLYQHLKEYADTYETKAFLQNDPAWFMHQVTGERNQETLAFLASCLSYGSRKQFFPKIQNFLDYSHDQPFHWVKDRMFESDIPNDNQCYYRLYSNHTIYALLNKLSILINEYGSLYHFISTNIKDKDAFYAIELIVDYFNKETEAIPMNAKSSCKRICMYLRWMTRDHSPVDLGIWSKIIDKRTLIMPLDTHVIQEANRLGLMNTSSTTMSVAKRLTAIMKDVFPEDPLKGDFALYGYDINHR
ncbi:TIGR02757 family protein [Prevotella sp. DNF00663]|uniref:TIGR02757 family protein n=1 Tax=unclassified Prevotella TaxID=2638335 RepID=UPI000795CFB5|nr:TIGR02757 family protein [Prevotella sp. DNF00663]